MTGTVFDIKRFAIHDGPGIRTTVFLKGCSLSCPWCHNPEGRETAPEISFIPEKCIACRYCAQVCPQSCHTIENGSHRFTRDRCEGCGLCVQECYAEALEILGEPMSVSRVLEEVMRDEPFYDVSGGGMTVSGGEPMEQFEFTQKLLQAAKTSRLHTCLETNGHAPFERYQQLLNLVDIFLYDLKGVDSKAHQGQVGVGCDLILENVEKIDACGGQLILRCPIIPGFNDREDHLYGIAAIGNGLDNIIEIELLPYHPLGRSKSSRIGRTYPLNELSYPDENTVNEWLRCIQGRTEVPVRCS